MQPQPVSHPMHERPFIHRFVTRDQFPNALSDTKRMVALVSNLRRNVDSEAFPGVFLPATLVIVTIFVNESSLAVVFVVQELTFVD